MEAIQIKHRGMEVAQILMKKGIDMPTLAKNVNLYEEHLYVLLGDKFLDYDIINFIGHKIGHDFSNEFPEIREECSLTIF